MKLFLINIISLILISFCFPSYVFSETLKADYKIELGKINIGLVSWTLEKNDTQYKTTIRLKNDGALSLFYKFSGNYLSEGKVLDGDLITSKYTQLWKTKKKEKGVEILFKNEMVYNLSLKPIEKNSPRIDYLNSRNLGDPLSCFLNILISGDSRFKTIDGRRLYKMIVENEKIIENSIVKNITIIEYLNIWADHKRNDLSLIEVEQTDSHNNIFPNKIKIRHKGLVFKLKKI